MKTLRSYLFVTIDGGGNLPPVLGLASDLRKHGHRVRVLTEPCLREITEKKGLEFLAFREYFTRLDRKEDIFNDWNAGPLSNPVLEKVVFGPAEAVIRETSRHLEAEPTDILVVDCLLFPALIAAERLGISRVVLFHMPEYLPGPNRPPGVLGLCPGKTALGRLRDRLITQVFYKVFNRDLPKINSIRASYGMAPLGSVVELLDGATRRLIQTSRAFDFPIEPAPANVRYTGTVLDDPDWAEPWQSPWPEEDQRPLVVVSFSTTFQNQRTTVQNCLRALGTLEVRGLLTLGPSMEDMEIEVPENVKTVVGASHAQIFPRAALVITHAGHGTLMRALAAGVPLLCVPMGRDQNDNAAKVVYHGCGLRLNAGSSPGSIRKAVLSILSSPSYRQRASLLGRTIREDARQNLGVQELENMEAVWVKSA